MSKIGGSKAYYTPSDDCNYLTIKQAISIFNVGATLMDKIAKECGAKLKIGRSVRYKKDILEDYFNSKVVKEDYK